MYRYHIDEISQSLKEIALELGRPFYTAPEFWAVFVALFIGIASPIFIEYLRRKPQKSNLSMVKVLIINQDNDPEEYQPKKLLDAGRLMIENKGKFIAKRVQAYIEKIVDNGEQREDFVPMPLNWTHGQLNKEGFITRDIYPNQTVYLDVFNHFLDIDYAGDRSVVLAVAAGMEFDSLSKLAIGESEMLIKIYQESGQVNDIKLKFSWNGKDIPTMEKL